MKIGEFTLEQWFALCQEVCVAAGLISAQALTIWTAWHSLKAVRPAKVSPSTGKEAANDSNAATTA